MVTFGVRPVGKLSPSERDGEPGYLASCSALLLEFQRGFAETRGRERNRARSRPVATCLRCCRGIRVDALRAWLAARRV
ncbi:uncharacterized protein UV8b_06079 [Ustilaginoidea virens]|uniref:Uncharacterized protein n=1 Tax=Ustilaginoidea virens TaxID=1159556 RepID=A0A8E5HUL9_USTVR|nr:uncharacterized protein UV8b_06079 [Ustilaginoidea virens]QUC21838.1 hypothetical protein UV8b_06079 [Ustilaginoidea virens]